VLRELSRECSRGSFNELSDSSNQARGMKSSRELSHGVTSIRKNCISVPRDYRDGPINHRHTVTDSKRVQGRYAICRETNGQGDREGQIHINDESSVVSWGLMRAPCGKRAQQSDEANG